MDLSRGGIPALNVRVAGNGAPVVCLHSSASSSAQWQPLVDAGQRRYRFIAVDLHGHGRSAPHGEGHYGLEAEADAVAAAMSAADGPVHLVGHSYGGAVALALAFAHSDRVASVTVYEPVLFGVLDRGSDDYREIASVGQSIARLARSGQPARAAHRFIDYWSGAGTWQAMADEARRRIEARMRAVALHFEALFADPMPLATLRSIRVPVHLLHGDRSPAPASAVARMLSTLDNVDTLVCAGLGHMGPVTHAPVVNEYVLARLERADATGRELRFAA
jgi:pimeloyl-ACP methyl ester carboxylesterase